MSPMSTALALSDSTLRNIKAQGFFRGIGMLNSESTALGAAELSWGTGAPNHTAVQGSVFIRLDAADSDTLFYRNTNGATSWEAVVGSELTDLLAATNAWTAANTFSHSTGVTTDVVTERTAGTGVTLDGLLVKDGLVSADFLVIPVVAVADAPGGATTAALTLQLRRADGTTALSSARQVMIRALNAQYQPIPPAVSTVTFGSATVGSIISSGAAWALVETDATGAFACTATDSADETVWFRAIPADSVSDVSKTCLVLAGISDSATWSA